MVPLGCLVAVDFFSGIADHVLIYLGLMLMTSRFSFLALVLLAFLAPAVAFPALIMRDGWVYQVEQAATMLPEDHYERAVSAWNCQNWGEAVLQFNIIQGNFPRYTCDHPEIYFFLGAGYYYLCEFDQANDHFSCYLEKSCSPEYLEETIEYKFAIAEQFRCGALRRILGSKRLPKWIGGKSYALKIYDEIICALPCHDLAAQSFYSKGMLLSEIKDYRCSVEAFQTLIRRFPMHELAPEAYLASLCVYLSQACCEYQNPDVLALAEIVLRRFREDFPNEERLCEGEELFAQMKEVFAYGLYETGAFYERTCHPQASVLYYSSTMHQFPDTCMADKASHRLVRLLGRYPCLVVPQMCTEEREPDFCSIGEDAADACKAS